MGVAGEIISESLIASLPVIGLYGGRQARSTLVLCWSGTKESDALPAFSKFFFLHLISCEGRESRD